MMILDFCLKNINIIYKTALLLGVLLLGSQLYSQHIPSDNQKLLFVGQDLSSVKNYKDNCVGCHKGHGEVSYLSFYTLEESFVSIDNSRSIYFGGIGMDNNGNRNSNNTNWGAGPLNLWTASERSTLITIGLSIVEDAFFGLDGLQKISNGEHDSKIIKMANFFNKFPETVFYLRIGYEFDGNWNGYNSVKYISAYKRIVDLLNQSLNQENVDYVWQSCTSPIDDILDGGQEDISAYYPGDDYVDWIGMSWFLRPNENPTVGNFIPSNQLALANELVDFAESKGKPVMIAESSPQGYKIADKTNCNISSIYDGASAQNCVVRVASQIYQEWFESLFNFIQENDQVVALSYINADWDNQFLWSSANGYASGYWGDTRIEEDANLTSLWNTSISDPMNGFLQTEDPTEILNILSTDEFVNNTTAFSLYPNPSSDYIFLSGVSEEFKYELFSTTGKRIINGEGAMIDLTNLSEGVYILKSKGLIKKIVKI